MRYVVVKERLENLPLTYVLSNMCHTGTTETNPPKFEDIQENKKKKMI